MIRSLCLIFFLTLTSLDSKGQTPPAATANAGAPVACPFANQNPSDSLAQVRASLNALSRSGDVCSSMISQNAANLDSILNSILEERFPVHQINIDGSTPLTCENFEVVLTRERQLARDSKNNQYYVIGADFLPRYRPCEMFKRPESEIDESTLAPEYQGITQGQRFDVCVDRIFQENYYRKIEECEVRSELESENRRNQAYRDQVTQLTRVTQNLITSSANCNNADILRNITQAVIPLVTTIGTFSVANPLVGVGISFGGGIASALVDRFFNTNGPNEYLQLLENEEQTVNLNCLYYQVQNDTLACGRSNPIDAEAPETIPSCNVNDPEVFLEEILSLSQQLRRILGSNDPLVQADIADHIRNLLSQNLTLPDGEQVRALDYLERASQSLSSDPSQTGELLAGRRLGRVIAAHREWENAINTTPIDESAILASNAQLISSVRGENGEQPLDLIDTMRRFWTREQQGSSSTMIGRLRAMEDPNRFFSASPQASADLTTTRTTRISHDALIHLYQQRFQTKLAEDHESYLANRKAPGDSLHHTNLDYLIPIFQSCSLNAGMFYYQRRDGTHHSVNRVARNPGEVYSNVCEMFDCPHNPLLPQFQPRGGAESLPSQFRSYQCAINAQYNQLLNRLVTNYRQQGEICPPPPTPPAPPTPEVTTAAAAFDPVLDPNAGASSGGGLFGWLGDFFQGIGNFFKGLFSSDS
jgi:hypothetical protein